MMRMNHVWISRVRLVLMSVKRRGCQGAEVFRHRKWRYMLDETRIKRGNRRRSKWREDHLLRKIRQWPLIQKIFNKSVV